MKPIAITRWALQVEEPRALWFFLVFFCVLTALGYFQYWFYFLGIAGLVWWSFSTKLKHSIEFKEKQLHLVLDAKPGKHCIKIIELALVEGKEIQAICNHFFYIDNKETMMLQAEAQALIMSEQLKSKFRIEHNELVRLRRKGNRLLQEGEPVNEVMARLNLRKQRNEYICQES
jgi:hypothetical protein